MNAVTQTINSAGQAFVDFALPMLVQSSVLILILLLVDIALRRKVRAVFRYWIWMLVLLKLVLPTSLWSPVSFGTWFGDALEAPSIALRETPDLEQSPATSTAQPQATASDRAPGTTIPHDFVQDIHLPQTATPSHLAPAPTRQPQEAPVPIQTPSAPPATQVAASTPTLDWPALVLLGWLAIVVALSILLLQRALFVKGLVAQAEAAPARLQAALDECRTCMGLSNSLSLRISPNAASPAVCGLLRPIMLIPRTLAPKLRPRDLEAVLLHELAHVKRGDLWINLVQTLLQIVYFYNPLFWLANMLIRRAREQAVDEAVLVAMGDTACDYPDTLVNVARLAFKKRPALSLRLIGVVESKSALSARIKHILGRPIPKSARLGLWGLLTIIIVAVVFLPMAKARPMTDRARRIVELAETEARTLNHSYIGTEHILLALMRQEDAISAKVLANLGITIDALRAETNKLLKPGPEPVARRRLPRTPRAQRIMKYAKEEARTLDHDYLGTEHILLGLMREKEGIAAQVLGDLGLTWQQIRAETLKFVKVGGTQPPNPETASESGVRATLPDVDHEPFMLDLATAKLLTVPQAKSPAELWQAIKRVGQGDLVYDSRALVLVRDATTGADVTSVAESFKTYSIGQRLPEVLPVTTAEGRRYEIKILAADDKACTLTSSPIPPDKGAGGGALVDPAEAGRSTEQRSEGVAATSGEGTEEHPACPTVEFANGTTVRLLGVCEHPSQGKQWWRPDGSPLETAPYRTTGSRIPSHEGRRDYEFALRLAGPEGTKADWRVPGSSQGSNTGRAFGEGDDRLADVCAYMANQPENAETCTVLVGVAQGQWETRAIHRDLSHEDSYGLKDKDGSAVAFGVAYSRDGDTHVPVTTNFPRNRMDYRIVAIDKQGESHIGGRSGAGGNVLMSATCMFDLPLTGIKEFHFQTRPRIWITFADVSLRPRQKTDVQISFGATAEESMGGQPAVEAAKEPTQETAHADAQSTLATLPNGVTIEFLAYSWLSPQHGLIWYDPQGQEITLPSVYEADVEGLGTVLAFRVEPPEASVYAELFRGPDAENIEKTWQLPDSSTRLFALGQERGFVNLRFLTSVTMPATVGIIPLAEKDLNQLVDVNKFGVGKIVDLQVVDRTESETSGGTAEPPSLQFTCINARGSYPRLVALLDTEGRTHPLELVTRRRGDGTYAGRISSDRLAGLVAEAAPRHEADVRFRNLSLTPSHTTEIQIETDTDQRIGWVPSDAHLHLQSLTDNLKRHQKHFGNRVPNSLWGLRSYYDEDTFNWLSANVTYIADRQNLTDGARIPIAYEKTLLAQGKGTYVVYSDAKLEFASESQLQKLGILPADGRDTLSELDPKPAPANPGDIDRAPSDGPTPTGFSGRVFDPNGNPAPGAQVTLCTREIGVVLRDGTLQQSRTSDTRKGPIVETDPRGRFHLNVEPINDSTIIAAHETGYAEVALVDFRGNSTIALQPWGRIEGQLAEGRQALDNRIWMGGLPNVTWLKHKRQFRYETHCDAERRFTFSKVPAGWFEVGYLAEMGDFTSSLTSRTPVMVEPRKTAAVTLGGEGRPVVGRFVPPPGHSGPVYFGAGLRALDTVRPDRPTPDNYDQMTRRQQQEWLKQWHETPAAEDYRKAVWHDPNRRHYIFRIQADGTFRIQDVIPGKYTLTVWLEERLTGQGRPEEIGGYTGTVTVPPMDEAYSDEPLDLGDLVLKMRTPLHVGDVAPPFEARTIDGRDISLIDYRGRYVLLSFWSPTFHPELGRLKALHADYKSTGRLQIIGLGGTDTLNEVRSYVREHSIEWPQVYFGLDWDADLLRQLGGQMQILLIDPYGKIIATWLRGDTLTETVRNTLEEAQRADRVPLLIDYPDPGPSIYDREQYALPVDFKVPLADEQPLVLVPRDVTNVARGKPVTPSRDFPILGEVEYVTDGDKRLMHYFEFEPEKIHPHGGAYVTIDLGQEHEIHAVAWWHSFSRTVVYWDVVVQVSTNPQFQNATTLYNNDADNSLGLGKGTDLSYIETNKGWVVAANGVLGRYIRLHNRGNSMGYLAQYTEVEVYGRLPP